MTTAKQKGWLLLALGVVLAAITGVVIWQRGNLIVEPWVIAVIAVPWVGLGVTLRAKADTWGFEGKYLDWWSVPHFTAGVLFALVGVGVFVVVAIAAVWEVVEIYARTREYPANRVVDIALAAAGWVSANALAGGAFPLL